MDLSDFWGTIANDTLKSYVDNAISSFESGDSFQLQEDLYQLVSLLNKPGTGKYITGFSQKDRLCEVFNLCLQYDWMNDPSIREVWAENAFYCIADYFKNAQTRQDYYAAALDLFLTCYYGRISLKPKFNDILRKARLHPVHSSIFTQDEYDRGADYLIREFSFFSAACISPIVKAHPNIISPGLKSAYESAKYDLVFASIPYDEIEKKIFFISSIIGTILNNY